MNSTMMYYDMVGSVVRQKIVVHFGPFESIGGMSNMMLNLSNNLKNWQIKIVKTHSNNSVLSMLREWHNSRRTLNKMIFQKKIDLAHIHVTHSLSWWRKLGIIKKCIKNGIPVIIHIHSGRFDIFCSTIFGIPGRALKRVSENNEICKVVVLENRWLELLKNWIPGDSEVIRNYSNINFKSRSKNREKNENLQILMMARDSKGKGHEFAIKIMEDILSKENKIKLVMTGKNPEELEDDLDGHIIARGWVSNEEKNRLIDESDFLISPSLFEGSSMSIIESICCGLPCIVSTASSETLGVPELVLDVSNPKDWSKKILNLSKEDEYKRILAEIEIQKNKYNPKIINSQWDEIYEKLIKN